MQNSNKLQKKSLHKIWWLVVRRRCMQGKRETTTTTTILAAEWEDDAAREQEQRQLLLLLLLPYLPSQQPSVRRCSSCGSADEKHNTRKEGKLPMDKKNEVHIPDPKPGPEHEVHIYEVQSPDTRGRPHIESPIWESVFLIKILIRFFFKLVNFLIIS